MNGGGAGPDPRFNPPASFWAILAGMAALGAAALWFAFHAQITAALIAWKRAELGLVGVFTSGYADLDEALRHADPGRFAVSHVYRMFDLVGRTMRTPAALALAALGAAALFWTPSRRFRGRLTPDDVFRMQPPRLRSAGAFVERAHTQGMVEPRDGRPRQTDFALHGAEWLRRFAWGLSGLREDRGRRELARQLGPVWEGVEAAPCHARVLFAAFALHAARRRDAAALFLGDVVCTLPPSADKGETPIAVSPEVVQIADAFLKDPEVVGACRDIADRHAFTSTALMGVLQHARDRSGVLAPAQLSWLKLVDRHLWYALHNVGMPTPYAEARGSRAHWDAERALGEPIPVPHVDQAMEGLRDRAGEAVHPPS